MCTRKNTNKPLNRETLCPRWDSNPHTFRYRILSAARLPFRHSGAQYTGAMIAQPQCCEQRDHFPCAELLYMQIG